MVSGRGSTAAGGASLSGKNTDNHHDKAEKLALLLQSHSFAHHLIRILVEKEGRVLSYMQGGCDRIRRR